MRLQSPEVLELAAAGGIWAVVARVVWAGNDKPLEQSCAVLLLPDQIDLAGMLFAVVDSVGVVGDIISRCVNLTKGLSGHRARYRVSAREKSREVPNSPSVR